MTGRGFALPFFLLGILILVVLGGLYYYNRTNLRKNLESSPSVIQPSIKTSPSDRNSAIKEIERVLQSKKPRPGWKFFVDGYGEYYLQIPSNWSVGPYPSPDDLIGTSGWVSTFTLNDQKIDVYKYMLHMKGAPREVLPREIFFSSEEYQYHPEKFIYTILKDTSDEFRIIWEARPEYEQGPGWGVVSYLRPGNVVYIIGAYSKNKDSRLLDVLDGVVSNFEFVGAR